MMKVSLFITCLTDLFSPQVGMATVDVLEYFGCAVDFPQAQTCCGQPSFNNGYPDQARDLAWRMIRVFEKSDYVVTPSGSCCAMIRDHYAGLFEDDPAKLRAAEDFIGRTYEFVEFLTKILKVDVSGLALSRPVKATYHYTCHLRGLGATGEPAIKMLRELGNCDFVPLEKAEQCCGFGGTFAVKYPEISGAIVRDKVACGQKTGADVMIVNDAGCAMNIGGACHRYQGKFEAKHIAELLAQAISTTKEPV